MVCYEFYGLFIEKLEEATIADFSGIERLGISLPRIRILRSDYSAELRSEYMSILIVQKGGDGSEEACGCLDYSVNESTEEHAHVCQFINAYNERTV